MFIELMSPAGNIESFLNAIENGADSVYLGLKKFNARRPAENFTIFYLKKVINIAHQKKKKVYLALNIDLKSNELKEIAQILELSQIIKIDAILVKDPAIIYLINKFFKDKLTMHFSTQNAICSSYGIEFARNIGAKRVVLPRELELSEIKKACSINKIECEIFVEGSMCFTISGRCLMSSWVGGRSGNRGVCTAPCRVLWESNFKKNPYFSMKDLSLINLLSEVKNSGILSLKIEGRLKNALWVGKITNIYRKAIDQSISLKEIIDQYKDLKKFSAREIDEGHIHKHNDLTSYNEEWQNYQSSKLASTTNNKNFCDKNEIYISYEKNFIKISINLFEKYSENNIKIPSKSFKAKLVPLDKIKEQLKNDKIVLKNKIKININNQNFKTTSSLIQKIIKEIQSQIKTIIREEEKLPELLKDISDTISYKEYPFKRERLLGDYPDKIIITNGQTSMFLKDNFPIKTIVISLVNPIDIHRVKKLEEKYNLILSIPQVLFEKEAEKMKDYINYLFNNGFKNFEANSFTGLSILKGLECNKYLGTGMSIMNHLAAKFFYDFNYSSVYSTVEGDIYIFKSLSVYTIGKIETLVFGKIPLFQSRVSSTFFKDRAIFKDKFGIEVECNKEKDLNIFVSKSPFSLIGEKIKNEKIYFDSLTADLRYFNNPINALESIFNNKLKNNDFNTFNFYRKLY